MECKEEGTECKEEGTALFLAFPQALARCLPLPPPWARSLSLGTSTPPSLLILATLPLPCTAWP